MTTTPARLIVRAEAMLAILPFASTEETRYYLRGVFAEPHPTQGVTLVATDGHRMPFLQDPMAVVIGLPQIWSKETLALLKTNVAQVRKTNKHITLPLWLDLQQKEGAVSAGTMRLLHAESAQHVLDGTGIEHTAQNSETLILDGTFPDYKRVMPNGGAPETTQPPEAFQGRYLKDAVDFGAALAKLNDSTGSIDYAMIVSSSPGSPVWIHFPEALDPCAVCGAVLLMPVRNRGMDALKAPSWLNNIFSSQHGTASSKQQKDA